jgi:hypothetical protein
MLGALIYSCPQSLEWVSANPLERLSAMSLNLHLTTEAGRLDAVRRCRAARAEHKAALKAKREAKAKAEWEAERKRCTFCRKPQSEVRLLGDVNFICDGCVGLAAQEIGVEKTISREARVQIVRDAIENDLEIILDALKLKSSEFVSDFSMIWRDANGRRSIAR